MCLKQKSSMIRFALRILCEKRGMLEDELKTVAMVQMSFDSS